MVFIFGQRSEASPAVDPTTLSREELLTQQYREKWQSRPSRGAETVPAFYRRVHPATNTLQFRLLEEARGMSLSRINSKILDNEDIQDLWSLFQEHADTFSGKNEGGTESAEKTPEEKHYLSYSSYTSLRRRVSPKVQAYLRANVFLALISTSDPGGRNLVRISDLFSYVVRKVWLERTRLALSLYDLEGHGYLREGDLEQYIEELIPGIDSLSAMNPDFKRFYVCGALRKFFFFLDPGRQGKVKITRMLGSPLMQELMDVRESGEKADEKNWFTLKCSLEVYNDYLTLDRKRNGLLTPEEFRNYPKANLSKTFVKRVYEECLTYNREMDYKTFLDMVLALNNRNEPASIRFLFRILDIHHQGAIDRQTVYFFFKDIQQMLLDDNIHPPSFVDVEAEIFDMIPSSTYGWISLNDLIKSHLGGVVVGLLIDKDCFLAYEFREQQLGAPS